MTEDMNIIRKVVWSYVRSTGLEYEDLYSEACLAYLEALPSYDPNKSKKTTFVWNVTKNRINNILKAYSRNKEEPLSDGEAMEELLQGREEWNPEHVVISEEYWQELFGSLSPEAQVICHMVNNGEIYIDTDKPRQARGIIAKTLREQGWGKSKIWKTFKEIKSVLNCPDV